jgi:hypothetical protein
MGCCNQSSVALSPAKPDPSQHVNYAKGMVLGVDDFTQEFAYLSGRDQWLARDAIGYGTLSGLAVTIEDAGADGPRVRVAAGSALSPSGKLICVDSDQCALLNQWLAKTENAKQVTALTGGVSPPASSISLYLTLCYADCQTAPVPIPGEPCRSEADLMANSRIADSFGLELRTAPPAQVEEQALRDYVQWLRQVPIGAGASPPATDADLLAALRAAAQPWFDAFASSPPASPPVSLSDFLYGSPPPSLEIESDQLSMLLRVALRFWVTELRPMWMACCCACAGSEPAEDDCLLLARVDVPVIQIAGVWSVDSARLNYADPAASDLQVVEDDRPVLVHQRLLQEWLLTAPEALSPQDLSTAATPQFFGLTTTGAVQIEVDTLTASRTLDASHHCVICTVDGITVGFPPPAANNRGRVYIVKNARPASPPGTGVNVVIAASPPVALETLAGGEAGTFVSDGATAWHLIAAA